MAHQQLYVKFWDGQKRLFSNRETVKDIKGIFEQLRSKMITQGIKPLCKSEIQVSSDGQPVHTIPGPAF